MKAKIRIDTGSEALRFSNITSTLEGKITVTDNKGLRVNAKSLVGMVYAIEFEELWCESEKDIYSAIEEFVIIE
jgi:hypothetical protein